MWTRTDQRESIVLVLLNHWLWFKHFSVLQSSVVIVPTPNQYQYSPHHPFSSQQQQRLEAIPSFRDISSFFAVLVWLVPFAMFVSLSAGDNVLPTTNTIISNGSEYVRGSGSLGDDGVDNAGKRLTTTRRTREKKGMAKAVVDGVGDWLGEMGQSLGFGGRAKDKRGRFD